MQRLAESLSGYVTEVSGDTSEFVDPPTKPETEVQGTTGTDVSGGRVYRIEDNDDLEGVEWIAQARMMRRTDPMCRALVAAIRSTLLSATWRWVVPDAAPDEAHDVAAALNEQFGMEGRRARLDGGWEGLLRSLLRYVETGWKYNELVWDVQDGLVWAVRTVDCVPDAHEDWIVDEHNRLIGVRQNPPMASRQRNMTIPRNKLLCLVDEQDGSNFEGNGGVLRPCYYWHELKRHTATMLGVGVERWAVPSPKLQVDYEALERQATMLGGTAQELIERAQNAAEAYTSHEKAWLSSVVGVDFEQFGQGVLNTEGPIAVLQECDRQILTAGLLQFLLLGVNDTGSRAVGEVQETFFGRASVNHLDYVASVVESDFQAQWMVWNYPRLPREHWPRLEHEGLDESPLLSELDRLQGLGEAGLLTPTNADESALRHSLGLPRLNEDYEREPDERRSLGRGGPAAMLAATRGRVQRRQGGNT